MGIVQCACAILHVHRAKREFYFESKTSDIWTEKKTGQKIIGPRKNEEEKKTQIKRRKGKERSTYLREKFLILTPYQVLHFLGFHDQVST